MNQISCLFILATVLLVNSIGVPGGFENLNLKKHPDIDRIARKAVDAYNNQTRKRYSLVKVKSAEVKIISGKLYQINATIVETNCKKNPCKNLYCSFLVAVTSWEKNEKFNYPELNCS